MKSKFKTFLLAFMSLFFIFFFVGAIVYFIYRVILKLSNNIEFENLKNKVIRKYNRASNELNNLTDEIRDEVEDLKEEIKDEIKEEVEPVIKEVKKNIYNKEYLKKTLSPKKSVSVAKLKVTDGLNERQNKLLQFVRSNKSVSMVEVNNMFQDVTQRTIRRDFEKLEKEGYVKQQGTTRNSVYVLIG